MPPMNLLWLGELALLHLCPSAVAERGYPKLFVRLHLPEPGRKPSRDRVARLRDVPDGTC